MNQIENDDNVFKAEEGLDKAAIWQDSEEQELLDGFQKIIAYLRNFK